MKKIEENKIKNHFIKRTEKYNTSSNWVNDEILLKKIHNISEATEDSVVLDIATGTGLVSKQFYKKVKQVVGIDICESMVTKSKWVNDIYYANAECMPFDNNTFDIIVCRQGLQFMELNKVFKESYRVLKLNGIIVLCHLTSHNNTDKELSFHIQKLRNPARKNFFTPDDVPNALEQAGFRNIESFPYFSRESINQWIDNGAISYNDMENIRQLYNGADQEFKDLHNIEFIENDILDTMKFVIVKGRK